MPTEAKVATVESLKARLHGARTVVLTEYRGLTVQQLGALRRQLRGASAQYRVAKNRLVRLAVAGTELAGLHAHLTGPTGIVVSREDPVAVAKVLQAFARTTPTLAVKAGVIEGQVLDPAGLKALAELPSREAVRAQLVGVIQGPLAGLVGLLAAPQRELAYVLAEHGRTGDA